MAIKDTLIKLWFINVMNIMWPLKDPWTKPKGEGLRVGGGGGWGGGKWWQEDGDNCT